MPVGPASRSVARESFPISDDPAKTATLKFVPPMSMATVLIIAKQ
jgi:hypothetical protein